MTINATSLPAHIEHAMLGTMRVPRFDDVQRAAQAIAPHVRRTQLLRSPRLDALAGGAVWLKPESLQVTGSFKARGAFNALLALTPAERQRGVVAYSTGNHGQAIAWAARQLGVSATIVMPVDAPKNKVARAIAQGAQVVHYDREKESREDIGMRLLAETGGTLVPPGDHPDVLAAQGTVALEALEDLPPGEREKLGLFAAPCGGGGLMAGCCLVLDALSPQARRVAVEPASFDDTVRSLQSGRRETNAPGARTLCDALQAATPAELPFAINQPLLSQAVSVTDDEVAHAMRFALEELHLVVEPGGSVALAALLAGHLSLDGQGAVIVLSGGNVDLPVLQAAMVRAER
ncbi:threonine ammonia-lyase [Variovorax arabinosiphilus]|uniref:threonine ammonia-lyase n=1 Tax=Variovorax arabinosiphilus TaxID=3053498 RepID=UPI002577FD58|nr:MULTISPECIES: threonine/serine dehydratase [unclassified Variovorax]MDM0119684.1 threonine/serine dehydratase [Variovorax sp. J2L1-78]MDM0128404.1 threonine/serine dehydratase [Variovorax sp. J2L1-63]MDM0232104.1 threonine/serine dehydratase [Variovorax sp. J2R1-6]